MSDFILGVAGVPTGSISNITGLMVGEAINSNNPSKESKNNIENHLQNSVQMTHTEIQQHQINKEQYLDRAVTSFVCASVFLALGACCIKDKLNQLTEQRNKKIKVK